MATRNEKKPREPWLDEESENLLELDMDDSDLFLDDLDVDEDEEEFDQAADKYRSFSARRRIEIAREDRLLKSLMSDFDDFEFDGIEGLHEQPLVEGFSY
jgi:hypothetical protein